MTGQIAVGIARATGGKGWQAGVDGQGLRGLPAVALDWRLRVLRGAMAG